MPMSSALEKKKKIDRMEKRSEINYIADVTGFHDKKND